MVWDLSFGVYFGGLGFRVWFGVGLGFRFRVQALGLLSFLGDRGKLSLQEILQELFNHTFRPAHKGLIIKGRVL